MNRINFKKINLIISIIFNYRTYLVLFYRLGWWHINSFSDSPYAADVVAHLNRSVIRNSVLDIGCGLCSILRRINYREKKAFDRKQNILKAAALISRFHNIGNEISFERFDLKTDRVTGKFDAVIMINYVHNINPDEFKQIIRRIYYENLNSLGEIIFDTVSFKAKQYPFNHDANHLVNDLDGSLVLIGRYEFGRSIYSLKKNTTTEWE